MKVLHFSDLHLGIENYGTIDPSTGMHTCFKDFIASLDYLVNYALDEGVDAIIFCGDAYRNRDPSQTQQREFAIRINRLASHGIITFLLVGNHDISNAVGRATAVEIFDTLSIKNIVVANKPGIYKINTRSGLLQVLAIPWLRRSALLTRESDKNLPAEAVIRRLEEEIIKRLEAEAVLIDPTIPCIVAAHVTLANSVPGTERTMLIGGDPVLLQSVFIKPNIDYIALGHIHKKQVSEWQPSIAYAGSLQRIDFSDENQEKGFFIVDIDPLKSAGRRAASPVFHTVPSRLFCTIEVKIPATEINPTSFVLNSVEKYSGKIKGAIVRLQITVIEGLEDLLYEHEIRKVLGEAQDVKIVKNIQRQHRLRLGNKSVEGISPVQALEVWLNNKSFSQEHRNLVLDFGKRLIKEEL